MFNFKDKVNNNVILFFSILSVFSYSIFIRIFNLDKIKNLFNEITGEYFLFNKLSYENAIISSKNYIETNLFSPNFFTDLLNFIYKIFPYNFDVINFYFSIILGSLIVVPIIYYFNKINHFSLGFLIAIIITSITPYYNLTNGGVLNSSILLILFITIIQMISILHIKSIIERETVTNDLHYYLIPILLSLSINLNNDMYYFCYINVVIFLLMSMKYVSINFLTLAIIYLISTFSFSSDYIFNTIIILFLSILIKGYSNIKTNKFLILKGGDKYNLNKIDTTTFGNFFFNTIVLLIVSLLINIKVMTTDLEDIYFSTFQSFPSNIMDTANYFFFANTIFFYLSILIGIYFIFFKKEYFIVLIVLDIFGLLTFINNSENYYYLIYIVSFGLAIFILMISTLLIKYFHKNNIKMFYVYSVVFLLSLSYLNFEELRISSKSILNYNYDILEISKNKKFNKDDYVISTYNNSIDIKYFLKTNVISSYDYKNIDNIMLHNILYSTNDYKSSINNYLKVYNDYLKEDRRIKINFMTYLEKKYDIKTINDFKEFNNKINMSKIIIPGNPLNNQDDKKIENEKNYNVYFYLSLKDLRNFLSASKMYEGFDWFYEKDLATKDEKNIKENYFLVSDGKTNYYLSNKFKETTFFKILNNELKEEFKILAKHNNSILVNLIN